MLRPTVAVSRGVELGFLIAVIVVGVDLNLAHAPTNTPYTAISLRAHGEAMTPEQALRAFLVRLERWLPRWEVEGFGPVREAWLAFAPGLGTEVTVTMGDRQQRGVFNGLDADGAMRLATAVGTRRISAGEVAFGSM